MFGFLRWDQLKASGAAPLSRGFPLLVILVALLALSLRLSHTPRGLPYLHFSDEPKIAAPAIRMLQTGDLNPHFYRYGSLIIYMEAVVDAAHFLHLMGRPADQGPPLSRLADVKTGDRSWRWTISHPSFYHWNRNLIAILGTGTVLAIFALGQALGGRWVGLLAALFLAVAPFHVLLSARIMPDVPTTFFVVCAILFAVLFARGGDTSHIVASLVLCGLAGAVKYNAVTVLAAPAAALLWVTFTRKGAVRFWHWILLPLIPAAAFLIAMPYAVLDLPNFLQDAGIEVRHYRLQGHGPHTIEPGWEHLRFQLAEVVSELGWGAVALVLAGMAAAVRRPLVLLALVVPAVQIAFMVQMTIDVHRNFLIVYPLLAVIAALGVTVLWQAASELPRRVPARWGVVLLVAIALGSPGWRAVAAAREERASTETRTRAVEEAKRVLDRGGFDKVVVASQLRVHALDLARLDGAAEEASLKDVMSSFGNDPRSLYLLPAKIDRAFPLGSGNSWRGRRTWERFVENIDESQILARVSGKNVHWFESGVTLVDYVAGNPEVLLVAPPPRPSG